MANKMTDTTSSLNDWPHDARILRVVNAARGFVHNATGAARDELLVAVGDLNTHSKEIGEVKRPDTLIQKIEAMLERSPNNHPCREDWETTINVIRRVEANEPSEIRLLTPALKGEIADNIDPENRTATDLVQDVWDELAERGLVGATVRETHPAVFCEGLFEAACNKMEEKYQKTDDNAQFHDVGALRGYLYDFLLFYISTLPKRESVAQWQSIETAPYGVEILVCCLYSDGKRINTIANATRSHDDDDRDYWDGIDGIMDVKDLRFWMPITPLNSIEDGSAS